MKGEVKIDLYEYERLRNIENNFNEKVKEYKNKYKKMEDQYEVKKHEYEEKLKEIFEGGTIIKRNRNMIHILDYTYISTNKVVIELKEEIDELKKRPERCILF